MISGIDATFWLRVTGDDEFPESIWPTRMWENFIDAVSAQYPKSIIPNGGVNTALEQYNACIVAPRFIGFTTEEARSWFVLRWA